MLAHTHTGWGVAVSWIIFSCATGYGGNDSKSHDSAIFMLVHTHTLVGVLLLVGLSSLVLLDMEVMVLKVMTQQFLCSYTHTHTHTGWGVAVSWIIFTCATG